MSKKVMAVEVHVGNNLISVSATKCTMDNKNGEMLLVIQDDEGTTVACFKTWSYYKVLRETD